MPKVPAGPAAALLAQVAVLAVLAASVGLGPAGWLAGIASGLVTTVALALAQRHDRFRVDVLGPADRVTLVRAALVGGVAGLVADSFVRSTPLGPLVGLAAVALALDAVDGWVARRTSTVTPLGARFDEEVDSFLILVLSVYVAEQLGWWVLTIGLARYAFAVAGWRLRWLRRRLPPRYWGKVVAAVQGVTLAVAAADVLPRGLMQLLLVGSLALLAESFGRSIWWLWQRRHDPPDRRVAARTAASRAGASGEPAPPGRVRTAAAVVMSVLAVVIVWVALVAPNQTSRLSPGAFARVPLEALVLVAVVLVVPRPAGRLVVAVVGPILGLLTLVKVLDMGFFATFDRPFNPVSDWSYTGTAVETARDSFGRAGADLLVVCVVLLVLAVVVVTTLAVLRVTRIARRHRSWSLRTVGALGVVWVLCAAFGAQVGSAAPVASTSAADLAVDQVRAVRNGILDHSVFGNEIAEDRFRHTSGDQLLTALRGKDVIVAFVESYGEVAVQDSAFSPSVDAALDSGTQRLRAAGFSARSAWLTSPTFGGISWLAHSTLQSGVWVDTQRRYDQLVKGDRFTLSQAFKRAGWRTVGDVPSNNRTWPEGSSFYHYDRLYDRRDVGYEGPKFGYASMPDQYVLSAFQRLELAKRDRAPVMAEIDLVSSHEPWTRIPSMIDWDQVGDGSIYNTIPVSEVERSALWSDSKRVRAAYGRSIEYTMNALVSWVQRYGDDDLVVLALGDHQPAKVITGEGASHNVPVSIIAHDPSVLDRISGWRWQDGLRPGRQAPLWRMNAFRDRFLTAFGSRPATP